MNIKVYEYMILAAKKLQNGCTDPAGVGLDL